MLSSCLLFAEPGSRCQLNSPIRRVSQGSAPPPPPTHTPGLPQQHTPPPMHRVSRGSAGDQRKHRALLWLSGHCRADAVSPRQRATALETQGSSAHDPWMAGSLGFSAQVLLGPLPACQCRMEDTASNASVHPRTTAALNPQSQLWNLPAPPHALWLLPRLSGWSTAL